MSAAPETRAKLLTAEDVLDRMGKGRWELVRGEVRELTPPGGEHGSVTSTLHIDLGMHVRSHGLGRVFVAETGFLIARNPDTVRGPDIAFISSSRLPERVPKGWMTVIPDLVAEVVSPGDSAGEVEDKIRQWMDAGVRLLWAVYPDTRMVCIYRPGEEMRTVGEDDILDGEEVVADFSLLVRDIFA
jgi:Uma2 family endonuclease